MPSWTVGTVPIDLAGLTIELTDVVAIPAPPPFPGWGVGGILSPQRLHPTAHVVVDMVHDELVLIQGNEAAAHAWAESRHVRLHDLVLDRVDGERTILVRTAVVPHAEVTTLIDTGGRDTEFASAAVPGAGGGEQERLGGSVSGADVVGHAGGSGRPPGGRRAGPGGEPLDPRHDGSTGPDRDGRPARHGRGLQ